MPDQIPASQQASTPRRTPIASGLSLAGAVASFAATFVFLQRGRADEVIPMVLVTAAGVALLIAGVTGFQRDWCHRNPEKRHSGISTKTVDGVLCFIATLAGTFMGLGGLLLGAQLLVALEPGIDWWFRRFERVERLVTSSTTSPVDLVVQTSLFLAVSVFLFWYAITTALRIARS